MGNENLILGFNEVSDDNLKISLRQCEQVPQSIIITLNGYIDTYTSMFFQTQIEKVVEADYLNLIFDCADLSYVSSTGIGVFSALLKIIKTKGGDIVLLNLPNKVLEVFKLLGFSELFKFKDSLESAIHFFTKEKNELNSVFPKVFTCPVCAKRLKTSNSGRFRCSECKSILAVDEAGHVMVG